MGSRAMRVCFMVMVVVLISVGLGGTWAEAQVHHVVGGDRGWDTSSDIGAWLSGRVFRVGDNIWFLSWAAQDNITELSSLEEFLSCDLSNPIKMYTDGANKINLDGEGIRYFSSSNIDNCKNGLKVHVDVKSKPAVLAAGPTPSGSVALSGGSTLLWLGFALLCYMGF